jgi:hypothetical protein
MHVVDGSLVLGFICDWMSSIGTLHTVGTDTLSDSEVT